MSAQTTATPAPTMHASFSPALKAEKAAHGWVSLEQGGISFIEDQDAGAGLLCRTMLAGLDPRS